jgi:hypothetical protein
MGSRRKEKHRAGEGTMVNWGTQLVPELERKWVILGGLGQEQAYISSDCTCQQPKQRSFQKV